jgi:hypothetical protein
MVVETRLSFKVHNSENFVVKVMVTLLLKLYIYIYMNISHWLYKLLRLFL